jgi:predicted alpha/beta-hydrolase family hydrolase
MRAAGLLLTPGASANRTQPSLVAIDEAVSALGVVVERMNFPYTDAGRKAPDRPPVLLEAVRAGAAALAEKAKAKPARVFVGGRSMGGRMCSMAVADGLPAAGLVLVSYPLHPPGKPEKLRTEHFPALDVPCLFVSGTKDTFGSPAELEAATAAIPGDVTHVWIDGGDHGLRRKDAVVADAVVAWLRERLG